jgi:hypothetical protein
MTDHRPQDVLTGVRRILDEQGPPEQTIRAIRNLLDPPCDPVRIQRTDRGWPILRPSAWERHDDPEVP